VAVVLAIVSHQALELAGLHMEGVVTTAPCLDEHLPGALSIDVAAPGANDALHPPRWAAPV
jgi:hypothetical protein